MVLEESDSEDVSENDEDRVESWEDWIYERGYSNNVRHGYQGLDAATTGMQMVLGRTHSRKKR